VSTVTRCKSEKKNFFIFCLISILLYVGGSFFEVTSTDLGGALISVKVLYAGSCFLSPLFLMFILDYCEVSVRPAWRVLITAVPFVNMLLVWTTEMTGLIYAKFRYNGESMVHGLHVVEPGPLYYLVYLVSLVCIVISSVVIIRRGFIWGSRYRKTLILLMCLSGAPLISNIVFVLGNYILNGDFINTSFTPYVLVIMSTIFYYSVLRYDLFDFSTRAQSTVVDIVHDAVIFMNEDNNFSSANAAARELVPSLANFSKGRPLSDAVGWPDELKDLPSGGGLKEIDLSLVRDGETRYYKARIKSIEASGDNIGTVMLIQDTTKTVTLMKKLENAAYTDALTGLYNRRHFMELATILLERAKRACTPCSVLMFDLDMFKEVNDTYGHLAGDEVLRVMASKIREVIRSYDVFGRYGGEEFVVLMDSADMESAKARAELIRQQVESLVIRYSDVDIRITCSIGIAETPDGSEDINSLIERADVALYRAKHDGRNLVRTE
jgi:diguanylate cyclase (GGDEF)-like protein